MKELENFKGEVVGLASLAGMLRAVEEFPTVALPAAERSKESAPKSAPPKGVQ